MTYASSTPVSGSDRFDLSHDDLRSLYDGYRRRQAARLLRMIPREAVRPLYREAVAASVGSDRDERSDPLALLAGYCEALMPLPPFEVWYEDFRANRGAHDEDFAADSGVGPAAGDPATVASRPVEYRGRRWMARLRAFRDGSVWRGFISFESEPSAQCRTAEIFCEDGLQLLKARFRSLEPQALSAFLRSCMPEHFL